MNFRSDINGLRAAAVLAVILFHFNPEWLPGGFAGVDVFFVISGFLMTGIIFTGMAKENFSIAGFYMARVRRIIPALAFLCFCLIIFGFLFLIPKDLQILGKHASGSLLFFSNIMYWGEHSYFDASSHEKWLLHTWSLSVEWQFYILYPLLLTAINRLFGLGAAKKIVLAGTAISFLACVIQSTYWPVGAFYLLPARSWEMLIGGAAFLFPVSLGKTQRRTLEILGWAMILGSFFLLQEKVMWPGYLALIPVIGAFLVIQANSEKSMIVSSWLTQKIGLHSYSMYLWHWPIIVGTAYLGLSKNAYIMLLVLIATSMISYNLIERRRFSGRAILVSLPAMLAACVSSYWFDGLKFRVAPEFQLNESEYHSYYYGGYGYVINDISYIGAQKPDHDALIVGDSFALQYAKFFDTLGKEHNLKFATLFHHGCLTLPTYTRYTDGAEDAACAAEYGKLVPELSKNKTAPVILAGRWNKYNDNSGFRGDGKPTVFNDPEKFHAVLTSELDKLIEQGGHDRDYYIIGVPQDTEVFAFRCLSQTELLGSRMLNSCQEEEDFKRNETNDALASFAEQRKNVHFINPSDVLCNNGKCMLISNRRPIHSDRAHLSITGAEIVGSYVVKKTGIAESKSKALASQQ